MTRSEMNIPNMYFFSPNANVVYTEQDCDKGVFKSHWFSQLSKITL